MSKDSTRIKELEEKLSVYENSPYSKAYLTLHDQLMDMFQQLTLNEQDVTRTDADGTNYKAKQGKIDIFSDKDDKSFDRYSKFKDGILKDLETLDKLREKMKPEEQEDIDKTQNASRLKFFKGKEV